MNNETPRTDAVAKQYKAKKIRSADLLMHAKELELESARFRTLYDELKADLDEIAGGSGLGGISEWSLYKARELRKNGGIKPKDSKRIDACLLELTLKAIGLPEGKSESVTFRAGPGIVPTMFAEQTAQGLAFGAFNKLAEKTKL